MQTCVIITTRLLTQGAADFFGPGVMLAGCWPLNEDRYRHEAATLMSAPLEQKLVFLTELLSAHPRSAHYDAAFSQAEALDTEEEAFWRAEP